MWSPLALSPPRSVAPAWTSSGHQSARFGGTWMPTPGRSRLASRTSRTMSSTERGQDRLASRHEPDHVLDRDGAGPRRQVAVRGVADAGPPVALGRAGGDLRRLLAVIPPVRHEVLEDDLLDVVEPLERLQRGDPVVLGLADADEDAAGERDPQVARRA